MVCVCVCVVITHLMVCIGLCRRGSLGTVRSCNSGQNEQTVRNNALWRFQRDSSGTASAAAAGSKDARGDEATDKHDDGF